MLIISPLPLQMTTKPPNLPFLAKHTFAEDKQKEEEDDAIVAERRRTMFYSQCLLSSKGPLGAIWVAGYFFKRLKKRQITDTDITSSVDKILLEGLPSVTYRVLAYLLLGIVRIYSKKVEYLFEDCHETVSDINRFSIGKKVTPFRDIVRSSNLITLPKKYELDSFQLEVADSACRANIAENTDISLQVSAGKDVLAQYSLDKQRFEVVSTLWDDLYVNQTSHGFTTQQAMGSLLQTPDKAAIERETLTFAHTPPELALTPQPMDIDVKVSSPGHKKNFETSKEKLRGLRFSQEEEGMDGDRICGLDIELLNLINDYQEQTTGDWDENGVKNEPLEKDCDLPNVKDVPVLIEQTHDIEVLDAQAGATPEFVVVPNPAKKEKLQRRGKRKCMLDEATMLDNMIMKLAIKDASGLVCKRRKVPHTVIDLWRSHRIPSLSKIFVEPLIPCVAPELEYVNCEIKAEKNEPSTMQAVEPVQTTQAPSEQQDSVMPFTSQAIEPIQTTQTPQKHHDAVMPSPPPADSSRSTIAPGTPVQCPASARVFGSARAADSDGEGGQSFHAHDNMKEDIFVHEDDCFGPNLMAEMDATEGDSQEVHQNKNGGLSARSRTVATYLHQVIQRKKQQGVEAVTLLPIVERKTKRENAMLFFEVLVLSSGGLVNVTQEKAYGDVILQETPELEANLKNC